jgi:hypothetical protein
MPLGRVVADEPVAAVNLDVLVEHVVQHLAPEDLRDRGFDRVLLERGERDGLIRRVVRRGRNARVDHAGRPIDEAFERVLADDHFAELVLDRAERGDGLAELLALRRVPYRFTNRALRRAAAHRAELEAREVEDVERDLVALAHFSKQVLRRHAHVLEDDRGRRRAVKAHLVFFLAARHAGNARSTRKAENCSPSTLAKMMKRSAKPPFVIHIFSPFRT